MDENPDYVTIAHAQQSRYVAAVMRWDKRTDGYVMRECSRPLPQAAAEGLAQCWAITKELEYRP